MTEIAIDGYREGIYHFDRVKDAELWKRLRAAAAIESITTAEHGNMRVVDIPRVCRAVHSEGPNSNSLLVERYCSAEAFNDILHPTTP